MIPNLDEWAAAQAKERALLTRAAHRLLIVGTIHGNHWDQSTFPVTDLDGVLVAFSPELVLLEQRPEAPAFDGPPEMSYLRQRCLETGTPTVGVDWWTETAAPITSDDDRENRIVTRVLAAMASRPTARDTALFIGSSHVQPLLRRLTDAGWQHTDQPARVPISCVESPLPPGWLALLKARVAAERESATSAASAKWRQRHLDNADYFNELYRFLTA